MDMDFYEDIEEALEQELSQHSMIYRNSPIIRVAGEKIDWKASLSLPASFALWEASASSFPGAL